MAPVTPPAWLQAGSYSAQADRQALAGLLTPEPVSSPIAARPGVKPSYLGNGLKVTQRATPNMGVTVAGGTCYVSASSIIGGVYECQNDGNFDVTITAAHASLARRDLIVARVYDAVDDVGTENDVKIEAVAGTPASSPVRPATPGQAIALAEVLVPAASTSVVNANITDLRNRTVALGGILPVTGDTAVPAQPYPGQTIFRTDHNALILFDGAVWQYLAYGAWFVYTPAWSSSGTQPVLNNGTATGRYCQVGKTVTFHAHIQPGSSTTYGSGTYRVSLPVAPRAGNPSQILQVRVFDNSTGQAYMGQSTAASLTPTLTVQGSTNLDSAGPTTPITFAAGDSLQISGTYEAA